MLDGQELATSSETSLPEKTMLIPENDEALGTSFSESGIHETSQHDAFPVKTILVVEDDEALGAFFMETVVQETPHHAFLVTDGYQALKAVHDFTPHLLLLDYGLPHMNGLELYDQLCTRKELAHVPAIMVSAHCPWHEARDRNMICIQKPVELDALINTIERLLM